MVTKIRTILHSERGMSIIELLIASVMSLLVVGAALNFYLSQHKTWLTQSDVAEVQHNARTCLDEIAASLRMAGYGLDGHPAFKIGTDSLTVYYVQDSLVDTVLYYVHQMSENSDPILYRKLDSDLYPQVYSRCIESLNVNRISTSMFEVGLTARGEQADKELNPMDGYRRRTLTTEVRVRNLAI